jgi:LmbE family N-acetylglucosaminyl deacetylase
VSATPSKSYRVLLLIPQPDDEVVGCATAITRARRGGAEFFGLYLSTGVVAPEADWRWRRKTHSARVERRRQEALAAAAALGIQPVGFATRPARRLRFDLAEAQAEIRALATEHAVDVVWTPAYEGRHQDHDATNFLASTMAPWWRVLEYAAYNAWTSGGAQSFPALTGGETVVRLSATEAAQKAALLGLYQSQSRQLRRVHCQQEVLRPLATYDYRKPPHPGRLFYQRFAWLPFPIPQVDFTPPARVCARFARFAAGTAGTDDDELDKANPAIKREKGWKAHG